jgi:hypothetical protein
VRVRAAFLAAILSAPFASADDLVWIPLEPFRGASILAIGADPHSPGTLYASVYPQGFFKSTDSGATWSPAGPGGEVTVTDIAFDAISPGVLYVTTEHSLYKSSDGAVTWSLLALPADYGEEYGSLHVAAVATDPVVPDLVYADVWLSFLNSVWPEHAVKSTNGGTDWTVLPVRTYFTACGGIRVDPHSSAVHFSSSYVSPDFGESWTTSDNACGAFAWDPSDRFVLYRGYSGVERSVDGGATWTDFNEGLDGHWVASLAVDPFEPERVYAGTDSGIFTRVFPKRGVLSRTPRSQSPPRTASRP